ncbi:ABC transporter permease [Clostridium senegalense]|uniref:FtsX-like permease family protein n=1 Tax=Clostridium senegalense TaxID=1465809 RepID=A0A6M0H0H5_9CLOT|nr:FtsX-like permease family protein [Clostridium senegalense]NEU04089.1 FtsX-like permease family protein [Clostridium senegalense]
MKKFWGIIPRNIIKNKGRVFIMGISIVLAISLIVSLSIVGDSIIKNKSEEYINLGGGTYDIFTESNDYSLINEFAEENFLKTSIIETSVGICKVPNSKFEIEINGYNNIIEDKILNFKLLAGRYPEKNNEIALEEWILNELPVKYNLGDKIKLEYISQYFDENESYDLKQEDEFLLVGVLNYKNYESPLKNRAKAYVTSQFALNKEIYGKVNHRIYGVLKEKYSLNEVFLIISYINDYGSLSIGKNDAKIDGENNMNFLNSILSLLFLVIGTVSGIVIYNISNIMVTERTKEFGIFRALGASPKMIKSLVILEGVLVGVIFIPIAMVVGSILTKTFIKSQYINLGNLAELVYIPPKGIYFSLMIGFLTLIIGNYFPARRASKVSPMQAIFSNNNLNLKGHMLKVGLETKSSVRKKMSFSTNMAYLNLDRNKKRFITTVISLNIIVIMFFGVHYLINCLDPLSNYKEKFGGDFIIKSTSNINGYEMKNDKIEELQKIQGVKNIYKCKELNCSIEVPEKSITNTGFKYLRSIGELKEEESSTSDIKRYLFSSRILGYDNEEIDKLIPSVQEGDKTLDSVKNRPTVAIVQNINNKEYTDIKIGDTLNMIVPKYDKNGREEGVKNVPFTVVAILNSNSLGMSIGDVPIVPVVSNYSCENYLNLNGYIGCKIKCEEGFNFNDIKTKLNDSISDSKELTLKSYVEEYNKAKENNKDFAIMLYGFLTVIGIISIINLVNVMNMSVILRKKEISILRAIGLNNREVTIMIMSEGVFYGLASSILGSIFGTILTVIIYFNGRERISSLLTWSMPFNTIVNSIIIVTLICVSSAIIPIKSLFRKSIVESIKGIE